MLLSHLIQLLAGLLQPLQLPSLRETSQAANADTFNCAIGTFVYQGSFDHVKVRPTTVLVFHNL